MQRNAGRFGMPGQGSRRGRRSGRRVLAAGRWWRSLRRAPLRAPGHCEPCEYQARQGRCDKPICPRAVGVGVVCRCRPGCSCRGLRWTAGSGDRRRRLTSGSSRRTCHRRVACGAGPPRHHRPGRHSSGAPDQWVSAGGTVSLRAGQQAGCPCVRSAGDCSAAVLRHHHPWHRCRDEQQLGVLGLAGCRQQVRLATTTSSDCRWGVRGSYTQFNSAHPRLSAGGGHHPVDRPGGEAGRAP